jgi:hypothetical protein
VLEYQDALADEIVSRLGLPARSLCVDVGSNDGTDPGMPSVYGGRLDIVVACGAAIDLEYRVLGPLEVRAGGPALTGLADEPFFRTDGGRLEELRLVAAAGLVRPRATAALAPTQHPSR